MILRFSTSLYAAAALLILLPMTAVAAGRPPPIQYTSYCPGKLGVDYPWPLYSDSPAVRKFRDEIVIAMKSLYGFEYDETTLPEEVLLIGEPPRQITLPQGWLLIMDAFPGGYSTAVAIPPREGPFADEVGLRLLLEQKSRLFGNGGAVSIPTGPGDLENGVRLPCSPNDPTKRAPAIVLGIPYQGENNAES